MLTCAGIMTIRSPGVARRFTVAMGPFTSTMLADDATRRMVVCSGLMSVHMKPTGTCQRATGSSAIVAFQA